MCPSWAHPAAPQGHAEGLHLAWFDAALEGKDTEGDRIPPVRLYVELAREPGVVPA